MEDSSPNAKRAELRKAVYDLRERGLYAAAKWAAEQAAGRGGSPATCLMSVAAIT